MAHLGDHAVVIGGSIAGLFTARVFPSGHDYRARPDRVLEAQTLKSHKPANYKRGHSLPLSGRPDLMNDNVQVTPSEAKALKVPNK